MTAISRPLPSFPRGEMVGDGVTGSRRCHISGLRSSRSSRRPGKARSRGWLECPPSAGSQEVCITEFYGLKTSWMTSCGIRRVKWSLTGPEVKWCQSYRLDAINNAYMRVLHVQHRAVEGHCHVMGSNQGTGRHRKWYSQRP
ncbi:hypothetical protein J6590_027838 [Homalodisca vitripennis]|nr:hypothetical protein J6590_027838 [Homalodisca vitripennis]